MKVGSFEQRLEHARALRERALAAQGETDGGLASMRKPWETQALPARQAPAKPLGAPKSNVPRPRAPDPDAVSARPIRPFDSDIPVLPARAPDPEPAPLRRAAGIAAPAIAPTSAPRPRPGRLGRTFLGFALGLGLGAAIAWGLAQRPAVVSAPPAPQPATVAAESAPAAPIASPAAAPAPMPGPDKQTAMATAPVPAGPPRPVVSAPPAVAATLPAAPSPLDARRADGTLLAPGAADAPLDVAAPLLVAARMLPEPAVAIPGAAPPRPEVAPVPTTLAERPFADPAAPGPALWVDHGPVLERATLVSAQPLREMPLPADIGQSAAPFGPAATLHLLAPPHGPAADRQKITDAIAAAGFGVPEVSDLPINLRTPQIRYYHSADAATAERLGKALGFRVRDFSYVASPPPEGHIEIWLAGKSAKARARVKAKASEPGQAPLPPMPEEIQMQILRDRILSQMP